VGDRELRVPARRLALAVRAASLADATQEGQEAAVGGGGAAVSPYSL
jgi:hypothetical protein